MFQLVERPTEKSGAVRSPPQLQTQFLPVSVQRPCAMNTTHIQGTLCLLYICVHVKNSQTLAAIPLFGDRKNGEQRNGKRRHERGQGQDYTTTSITTAFLLTVSVSK